ncbi:MAG: lysyl oxidase family protein, partial [Actinomycetota bacterium]|nr:lysyl oxidase family protein [Actinomycetota bacterium]
QVVVLPWPWEVRYSPHLPGQYIEISGVRDGTYVLEIQIDPHNQLLESYERDNATCVLVRLEGDSATALRNEFCWPERT